MRQTLALSGAALGAALIASSPASAAVTFGQAKLAVQADARLNSGQSHSKTLDDLSTTTLSDSVSDLAGPNFSTAQASVAFNDPYAAAIDIKQLSAKASGAGVSQAGTTGYARASATLTYDFTIDASYLARISYDFTADPGVTLSYVIYPTGQYSNDNSGSFASGQGEIFTNPFGPGAYTLVISAGLDVVSYPGDPSKSEALKGGASFLLLPNGRISSPTPEPATWALLIGGFATAGLTLRRRRSPAAVA